MSNFEDIEQYLAKLSEINSSEIDFQPIKKWIFRHMAVEEILTGKSPNKKKGKGSIRTFKHNAFKEINETGHFVIHVMHKKKEKITRSTLKNYLIPRLKIIFEYMRRTEA